MLMPGMEGQLKKVKSATWNTALTAWIFQTKMSSFPAFLGEIPIPESLLLLDGNVFYFFYQKILIKPLMQWVKPSMSKFEWPKCKWHRYLNEMFFAPDSWILWWRHGDINSWNSGTCELWCPGWLQGSVPGLLWHGHVLPALFIADDQGEEQSGSQSFSTQRVREYFH